MQLAGLGQADIVGRPFVELIDPRLAASLEPHCRLALDGHPFACEHEADGRTYRSRGVPLRGDGGVIDGALIATYDITGQQEAEALRRRSEEAFATLIEHAPFAVFVVDAVGRLRAMNHGADAVFRGIEPLLGRAFADIAPSLWPESAATAIIRQFRHTLATGEPYASPRDAAARTAGRMAAYDWQIQRVTLPDGTAGVVCYAYDLAPIREAERVVAQAAAREWQPREMALAVEVAERTWAAVEQARAEARLRDSESRLKLVLDASGMGTFVWHLDEDRGEPDARALELLGLADLGVSLDQALDTLIPPEDRTPCAAILARALDPAGSGRLQTDIRVRRPDGGERWLAVTARTVFAGEPRRAVRLAGVVTDIDERKRTEASLRAREGALTGADRRKDEFLAVLAHELRNPLAPIRAGLELIRLSGTTATIARTREIMERQVGHMVRLIDDLLDVSRITSGKIQLQRRPTTLEALVTTAVDANREALNAADLQLSVALSDAPIWLDVDPTRLVQVISNVLHNAVKFTDGRGRIDITAVVEADGPGGRPALALTIADSGIGISAEMQPRIFDLFTQDRTVSSRSHGGLGIGLALARQLVEMHGGTIEAVSEGAGRGSVFTIRLPIAAAIDSPPVAAPARQPVTRTSHRVVVVDDNLDAAHATAMLVTALGGEARVAGDGASGLAHVLDWLPTLVLLDIEMPGMDGYETCRRIREAMGTRVAIVALTGWGQEQHKRDAERAGFDAHLTKPADPAALERLLAESPRR
ncbi:MAG: ATP-binding protein [Vicinamibacteraceae bacterium]